MHKQGDKIRSYTITNIFRKRGHPFALSFLASIGLLFRSCTLINASLVIFSCAYDFMIDYSCSPFFKKRM